MTLVVALATPKYVALMADHNVTVPEGGEWVLRDEIIKTLIIDRRYVLGFAGLARFRTKFFEPPPFTQGTGTRLGDWLWEELVHETAATRLDALADKFGTACELDGFDKRHWFLLAGFNPETDSPEIIQITNAVKKHSFDIERVSLEEGEPFLLRTVGQPVPPEAWQRFKDYVKTSLTRSPDLDAYNLIPEMVAMLRTVAEGSKGSVGTSCTVTTFPFSALPLDEGTSFYMGVPERWVFNQSEVSLTIGSVTNPVNSRVFVPPRLADDPGSIQFQEVHMSTQTDVLAVMKNAREQAFRR